MDVIAHLTERCERMQEKRVKGRPARRRPAHPHYAPRGVNRQHCVVFTKQDPPIIGLSDGRIYDPRSGSALDWWDVGRGAPQIDRASDPDVWQVEFADGAALCTPNGIWVTAEPVQGQLRVQMPPQVTNRPFLERWDGRTWIQPEPPYTRSRSRTLRREKQAGRRPVREGCPLLLSLRAERRHRPEVERRLLYR